MLHIPNQRPKPPAPFPSRIGLPDELFWGGGEACVTTTMTRSTTAAFHPTKPPPETHARRVEYPFPREKKKGGETGTDTMCGRIPTKDRREREEEQYTLEARDRKRTKRRGIHPSISSHSIPSRPSEVINPSSYPKKSNPTTQEKSSSRSSAAIVSKIQMCVPERKSSYPQANPEHIPMKMKAAKIEESSLRGRLFVAEFVVVVVVVGEEKKWSSR